MRWLLRTFGRSFVWKLGAMAALACVALLQKCYAQTIECASACTVTLDMKVSLLPFDMTIEAASKIAVAIAAVWATAWVIRTLAELISNGKPTQED